METQYNSWNFYRAPLDWVYAYVSIQCNRMK